MTASAQVDFCTRTNPHHHVHVTGGVWLEQVQAHLRKSGFRLTASRMDVLAWIAAHDQPFSAEDAVHAHADQLGRGSRSTIYRLVHLLRDERWLARVSVEWSEHAYLRQLPGHHYAICLGCGYWLLLGGCDLETVVAPSLLGSGFSIQRQELNVYGWCGGCRSAGVPT